MTKYKCTNCPWTGDERTIADPLKGIPSSDKCLVCGDNTVEVEGAVKSEQNKASSPEVVEEVKEDFDFNNDGKVDEEDVSLAAKLMGKTRANKSKKKKGKR